MKRFVLLMAMLAMLVFLVAPAALAQGQVERGPEHANSICSFSGLNDDPAEGGRVQSYGQGVRQGFFDPTDKQTVERPGVLCNGHDFPLQEGGPEE
jgi:hypothetical protein